MHSEVSTCHSQVTTTHGSSVNKARGNLSWIVHNYTLLFHCSLHAVFHLYSFCLNVNVQFSSHFLSLVLFLLCIVLFLFFPVFSFHPPLLRTPLSLCFLLSFCWWVKFPTVLGKSGVWSQDRGGGSAQSGSVFWLDDRPSSGRAKSLHSEGGSWCVAVAVGQDGNRSDCSPLLTVTLTETLQTWRDQPGK